MTIYETVKAVVTVSRAAERYGLQVGRNSMIRCPFHEDTHPSLKLYDDHFYCFGCGKHGDVIDLTTKLLGLSPLEAAEKLCADFGLLPDDAPPSDFAKKVQTQREEKVQRERELFCHRTLCRYLHLLEDWRVRYAPKTPDEPLHDRFVEALQMHDHIEYMANFLTFSEPEKRTEAVEILMRDNNITELAERLDLLEKEDEYA